jgi:hypothetical protein
MVPWLTTMRRGVVVVVVLGTLGCRDPAPAGMGDSTTETTGATGGSLGTADGSSSGESRSAQSLVVPEAWTPAEAADDPFADERPEPVECMLGWGVETGAFEVNTDLCLYGAFVQPTLAEVQQGDTLELVMLHDALYAVDPAVAHVAIALGDEPAWETEIPIPSEPELLRPSWTATADLPAGSPVHFHLHNHGVNNYRLIDLTVTPP